MVDVPEKLRMGPGVKGLDAEFVHFIRNDKEGIKMGAPVAWAMPGQDAMEHDIEAYYRTDKKWQAVCAPIGFACPCNVFAYIICMPCSVFACVTELSGVEEYVELQTSASRRMRLVLFEREIAILKKDPDGTIWKSDGYFLEDVEVVYTHDLDENYRDGINGCFQECCTTPGSGLKIFAGETRSVKRSTGNDTYQWIEVPIPSKRMHLNDPGIEGVIDQQIARLKRGEVSAGVPGLETASAALGPPSAPPPSYNPGYDPAPPGYSGVPNGGSSDVVTKIKELKDLKDMGVLSEEEFEKAKNKILA